MSNQSARSHRDLVNHYEARQAELVQVGNWRAAVHAAEAAEDHRRQARRAEQSE